MQGNGNADLRKKFYHKELVQYSKQVASDIDARSGEVTSVLSSSDAIMNEGREIDALFNKMLAERLGEDGVPSNSDVSSLSNEIGESSRDLHEEVENEKCEGKINWKGIQSCIYFISA